MTTLICPECGASLPSTSTTSRQICGDCGAELLVRGGSVVVADRKIAAKPATLAPPVLPPQQPLSSPTAPLIVPPIVPAIAQTVLPLKSAIAPPPVSSVPTTSKPSTGQQQSATGSAPPVVAPQPTGPPTATPKPQQPTESTAEKSTNEKSPVGKSSGKPTSPPPTANPTSALPPAADLLPAAAGILPPVIGGATNTLTTPSQETDSLRASAESGLLPPPVDPGFLPAAVAGVATATAGRPDAELEEQMRQILIPSEEGFVAVAETITKIKYGSQKIGVRNVSHEQRHEKRRIRSAIVFVVCLIFLVVVVVLLKNILN